MVDSANGWSNKTLTMSLDSVSQEFILKHNYQDTRIDH